MHARNLDERLKISLRPDLYEIVREYDGHPSKYVYKVKRLPFIDPEWSLILGDFLTNMRAALDHLAWQLVLLDGGTPNESTQFPIRESELNRNGNRASARLEGITRQDIIDAVVAVQPYEVARNIGSSPTNHGLYILKELVNIDKHRTLLVAAAVVNTGKMHWVSSEPLPRFKVNTQPLNDGDPVAWFDYGDMKADPDFNPNIGLEIRLDSGPSISAFRMPDLINLMGRIYTEVEHLVLGVQFAPIFNLSSRHWLHALSP